MVNCYSDGISRTTTPPPSSANLVTNTVTTSKKDILVADAMSLAGVLSSLLLLDFRQVIVLFKNHRCQPRVLSTSS